MTTNRQLPYVSAGWRLLFVLEILAAGAGGTEIAIGNQFWCCKPGGVLPILGIVFLAGIAWTCLWPWLQNTAARLARRLKQEPSIITRAILVTQSPLLLLFGLFLNRWLALNDLSKLLPILAGGGCVYFFLLSHVRLRQAPGLLAGGGTGAMLEAAPGHSSRNAVWVFCITLLVYLLFPLGLIFPPQPLTGDEPHYLLITYSLLHDGDSDLYNNYQHQDYMRFYPGKLDPHAYPGMKGPGHLYSKHFPALPLLLVPALWAGEVLSGWLPGDVAVRTAERNLSVIFCRLLLCVLSAGLVLLCFLICRDLSSQPRTSLIIWPLFAFTTPLLSFSHLLYPEVPVALLLLLVLRQAVVRRSASRCSLLLVALAIAALPLLGIKFSILAVAAFGLVLVNLWPQLRGQARMLWLLLPLLLAAALFSVFLWSQFGGFSPVAIYHGAEKARNIPLGRLFQQNIGEFGRSALAFFFDQRLGLFFYAPVYLLFIPGVFLTIRRSRRLGFSLLTLFAVCWIFYAFNLPRGGYCPPGRYLLPVLPLLAFFLAATSENGRRRTGGLLLTTLALLSFLMVALTIFQPRLLYHESLSSASTTREPFAKVLTAKSTALLDLRQTVPILIGPHGLNHLALIAWLLLAAGLTAYSLRKRGQVSPSSGPFSLAPHVCLVFGLAIIAAYYHFGNVRLDAGSYRTTRNLEVYFQDNHTFAPELGGFWLQGDSQSSIIVRSNSPLAHLVVQVSSPQKALVELGVGPERCLLALSANGVQEQTVRFDSPRGCPSRQDYLYQLRLRIVGGFVPQQFDSQSSDRRFLGAFIRISRND